MINTLFNHVPHWCWHNARYMCYTCYRIVCPAHMCAVLYSGVLHAVLSTAQPSQPLHNHWRQRSQVMLGDNPASASKSFSWAGPIYTCDTSQSFNNKP